MPARGRGLCTYFVKLRIDASQAWQIDAKRQVVNILRPNGLVLTLLGKRFGGIEREAYDKDRARSVSASGD
jgi:hypothetical protein